ncbi:MAG: hypothetical protein A3F17_05345 [Gammaproteobacteria bacterium RIFCSPHIGHO2_12_FULL_41_15]|nr:MAG: hypothetical protein A3F17_05345 [Gammaproteobacteria bacterium RIFCSPHIGHO2_12_FULL_41_15]
MNPIPLIEEFFHSAKQQKQQPQPLTGDDYKRIRIILNERTHEYFSGRSIVKVLLGIVYHGTSWYELQSRRLDTLLLDAVCLQANQFNRQEIANTLWALIKMGVKWRDLLYQDPSSSAHYQPSLSNRRSVLIDRLWEAIDWNIRHLNSQDIAKILWSLAKAGAQWHNLPENLSLDEGFLEAIVRNIEQFTSQEISMTLWGLVTMGVDWSYLRDKGLSRPLLFGIDHNVDQFNPQGIANTLWSLAVAGVEWYDFSETLADKLVAAIVRNKDQFLMAEATQIIWSATWFNIQLSWSIWHDLRHSAERDEYPRPSDFHQSISNLLRKNGLNNFTDEYCIREILYVDICFPDINLVVEVDGPHHMPTKDRLKEALLNRWGYTVIRLSYVDNHCHQRLEKKLTDIMQCHQLKTAQLNQSMHQENERNNVSWDGRFFNPHLCKRKRDDQQDLHSLPPWRILATEMPEMDSSNPVDRNGKRDSSSFLLNIDYQQPQASHLVCDIRIRKQ